MKTIHRPVHHNGILEFSLREELLDTRDEISIYAHTYFGETIHHHWLNLCKSYPIFLECEEAAFMPFSSWFIFCAPVSSRKKTIYLSYLETQLPSLKKRLHSYTLKTLEIWKQCYPSYYYQLEFKPDRVFPLLDVHDRIIKTTVSFQEIFIAPKRNDFMTGVLLPLGDGTFTPHFPILSLPDKIRKEASLEIINYCKSRWHLSPKEVLKKEYPKMLAIFLTHYMNLPKNERVYFNLDPYIEPLDNWF